jgi:hypothetical protein
MRVLADLLMERPSIRYSESFDHAVESSSAISANSLELLRGAAADAIALLMSPNLIRSPRRTPAQIVRVPSTSEPELAVIHFFPHDSPQDCARRASALNRHHCVLP